jgi:hypothetical protein
MNRRRPFRFLPAALLCALAIQAAPAAPRPVANPYAGVDWTRHEACKANLHTHTALSDGRLPPRKVIDRYAELDYAVLALTDHDTKGPGGDRQHPDREQTTWPWPRFGREPRRLNLVAIEGNEISARHHIGSYFTGYGDSSATSEENILAAIGRRGGLAVFFHPGRYERPAAWYANLFRRHPHALGVEVYSDGDSFPQDRQKWDDILEDLLPERPAWGFSNDDMHRPKNIGRNWNVLLLPERTPAAVRAGLESGAFFFAYCPQGPAGEPAPAVRQIAVDPAARTIRIEAEVDFARDRRANRTRLRWGRRAAGFEIHPRRTALARRRNRPRHPAVRTPSLARVPRLP